MEYNGLTLATVSADTLYDHLEGNQVAAAKKPEKSSSRRANRTLQLSQAWKLPKLNKRTTKFNRAAQRIF